MKKFFTVLLAFSITASLAGCDELADGQFIDDITEGTSVVTEATETVSESIITPNIIETEYNIWEDDNVDTTSTVTEKIEYTTVPTTTTTTVTTTVKTTTKATTKTTIKETTKETATPSYTTSKKHTTNSRSENTVVVPKTSEDVGNLVWVPTNGGKKYHKNSSCSKMKDPIQVSKETAEGNGYTPCKRCY